MKELPSFLQDLAPEELYSSDNYVVLDFETDTSHGDYGSAIHEKNQMLLAVWKLGPGHKEGDRDLRVKWGDELELDDLIKDIESADFIVAHQAKYELMWLKRCGMQLDNVIPFDTKIAEYVLMGNLAAGDKNMPPRSTSLDVCCKRRGFQAKDPVVNIMMQHGINPVEMPRPWLQGRCERDVEETERVFLHQRKQLRRTNRLPVLFTRCILTPVLGDTEFNGMALDPERVMEEYEEHVKQFNELSNQMDELTGGINWNSPKQVGEFLYDVLKFGELRKPNGEPKRTAAGKRLTDKNSLKKLKATTQRQKDFLDLKARLGKVSAALSKSLEFFKGVVDEAGGVFHAEFNQTVTATHRLSSSGVKMVFEQFDKAKQAQFQNLPNAFKRLFKAKRRGWKIGEGDGSQLEFRVAGHLGKDSQILEDINNKHDVHRFTASVLNGVSEEEVTKEQRKKAKADTFKPLYGGQSGTDKQKEYYAAFKRRYSELNATQETWIRDVLNRKVLITPWGMRYYWPYAKRSSSGYVNVTSAVYNYPIQALATAEIIPIAVTFFWHRVRVEGLADKIIIVNTVHDSVICEVHPNHQDDFRRLIIQSFGKDVYRYLREVYGIEFTIPLGAGVMLADHWADDTEGEEESYDIHIDGRVVKI
jgi:DNA polymerase-1